MNLNATYKYQLGDCKLSISIFYLVIVILQVASIILTRIYLYSYTDISGMEPATIIFLFIMGMCTFKEPFLMALQNGISRKTFFLSKIASTATISLIVAAIDIVVMRLLSQALCSIVGKLSYIPTLEAMFRENPGTFEFSALIQGFLFEACLAFLAIIAGYCISLMFYRLKKPGKIIVGAGVPVVWLILLPLLDETFNQGRLSVALARFFNYIFNSTFNTTVFSLVVSVLLLAASFLMIRRAKVK